jgi:hypothetical protein
MRVNAGRESRKEERVPVTLPVYLANLDCITRDISASGAYLETSSSFAAGERIDFSIEFDSPSGKLMFTCNGEVIRSEIQAGKVGLAVKIVDSVMESLESRTAQNPLPAYQH